MDKATPEMKAPADSKMQPPTEAMDKATPTMKSGDADTAGASPANKPGGAPGTSMQTWDQSYDSTKAQEEQLKSGGTKKK
jgi:hypothetical protein